jgi:hypothetical protein
MKILMGFLFMYLIMPFFGCFNFSLPMQRTYGTIDDYFITSYAIHIIIILIIVFILVAPASKISDFSYDATIDEKFINQILNRSILALFVAMFIELFVFGAINILLMKVGRGDFRITLGPLGFFYNFFTTYMPAGVIAFASVYYNLSDKRKEFTIKLIFIYLLAIIIGVLTGYKYTALLITSAGLVQMSSKIKTKYILLIGAAFLSLMTFSAYYFMKMDDPTTALGYVFARATSVALQGSVVVYNYFPEGGEDSLLALLYAFGNRIASLITGYSVTDVEFLKINITRLVGYLSYPEADKALSGAFNLTVTNFGEGVYYFGKYKYFIFSIITGLILGLSIRAYLQSRDKDNTIKHVMLNIYVMIIVLPWLMGGVIGSLFGIPTVVYMSLLYIVLKLIKSKFIFE